MRTIQSFLQSQESSTKKPIAEKAEWDSCATGVLVSSNLAPRSRVNIENALASLKILPHRGGAIPKRVADGTIVYIGDGAGVSCDIPWEFYNDWMEKNGMGKPKDKKTGEEKPVAIGNFFLPNDRKKRENAKRQIKKICEAHGVEMLSDSKTNYWRDIEFNSGDSDEVKHIKLQHFKQCFLAPKKGSKMTEAEFQNALIEITNEIQSYAQTQNETALKKGQAKPNLAIASLSTETVVYKGMILPGEVEHFADLQDDLFAPRRVIYHIRQSTNTSPSPGNAQPFLSVAHNGELNSVKGNARKNHKKSRGWSDSRTFNEHIGDMILQGTDIIEAITTLMPPVGGEFSGAVAEMLDDIKSKGLEYNGPAHMVFAHGNISGAKLDSSALRPSRYVITKDKYGHQHLYIGSEDLFSEEKLAEMEQTVVERGMLKAGEMIVLDGDKIKYNQQILEELAARYKKTEQEIVTIKAETSEISLEPKIALGKKELEIRKYQLLPLFGGEIKKIAMGDDTDPTGTDPRAIPTLASHFRQKFAQVSSPSLDSDKERPAFSLEMFLGDKTKKQDRKLLKINSPLLKLGELETIESAAGDLALTIDITFAATELEGKSDEKITKILRAKIDAICLQVAAQVKAGKSIVILDDSKVAKDRMALPDILVLGAVIEHLHKNGLHEKASLIVNSSQVDSAHHFSVLSSLGAAAVNPAGAYEFAKTLVLDKSDPAKAQKEYQKHCGTFHKAVEKAHLVTMAKYGINSIETYRDARLMETLSMDLEQTDDSPSCLGNAFNSIDQCGDFYGVFDVDNILLCGVASHQESYGEEITTSGHFAYSPKGVSHSYNPTVIRAVRNATTAYNTSRALFRKYSEISDALASTIGEIDRAENLNLKEEQSKLLRSNKERSLDLQAYNENIAVLSNENDRLLNSLFFVDKMFVELKKLLDKQKKGGLSSGEKGDIKKQIDLLEGCLFVKGREGKKRELSFRTICGNYLKEGASSDILRANLYLYLGYHNSELDKIQQWTGFIKDGNLEAADQVLKQMPEHNRERVQILYNKYKSNSSQIKNLKAANSELSSSMAIDGVMISCINKAIKAKQDSSVSDKDCYSAALATELASFTRKKQANDITPERGEDGAFLAEAMDQHQIDQPFRNAMAEISHNKKTNRVSIADHVDIKKPHKKKTLTGKVQSVSSLLKDHFVTGGMSHGALTLSAHNDIAEAARLTGSKSCTGEGGKPTGQVAKSVQISSGRFGINPEYFADAEVVEIKIVQGAKPGEGGQLPGGKVSIAIAAKRGCTPGINLISPPPHHDIYSIEDLQQLIHDIKELKPGVKVAVKLCASEGIDQIAIGVAKSGADIINIASASGGTGAASVDAIKQTGFPSEVGLKMVHKALSEAGIRDLVRLQVSGFPNTPEGVVLMAILGGDIFESGTTDLMLLGCDMHRKCGVPGACGPGITNNEEGYEGNAENLALYRLNMAAAVQEILEELGVHSLAELRGRVDLISAESLRGKVSDKFITALTENVEHFKQLTEAELQVFKDNANKGTNLKIYAKLREVDSQGMDLDAKMQGAKSFVVDGGELNVTNRTFGASLVFEHYQTLDAQLENGEFRAEDHCTITTSGNSGQSHGAFNSHGICLVHTGPVQDGFAKSMCGGVVVVKVPPSEVGLENSIYVGNAALYGASGGKAFVAGAGSRCGILMKGATLVVNGNVGDYGCEYMTSGSVVVLGRVGNYFGSGMYGGIAILYNKGGMNDHAISEDTRDLIKVDRQPTLEEEKERENYLTALHDLLIENLERTGDKEAKRILADWENEKRNFKIVVPKSLDKIQTAQHLSDVEASFGQRDNVKKFGDAAISPFEKVWLENKKLEIEAGKLARKPQEPNIYLDMLGDCNVFYHQHSKRMQQYTPTHARAVGGLGYPDEILSDDLEELKTELFTHSKKCSCDAVTCSGEDTAEATQSATGCPTHKNPNLINAILKDTSLIEDDRIKQAFLMQVKESPFPGFTGSACPAPCQDSCTHSATDSGNGEAVKIKRIELLLHKIAMIQGLYDSEEIFKAPKVKTNKKVMIIGSGPSALEAAYHLAKKGMQVEIFEKSDKIGGLLRYGIPDHKLQKDTIDFYVEELKKMGVKFHTKKEVDITKIQEQHKGFDMYLDGRGIAGSPIILDEKLSKTTIDEGGNHAMAMGFLEYCNRFFYETRNPSDAEMEHPFTKFKLGKSPVVMGYGDTAEDVIRSILKLNGDLEEDDEKRLSSLDIISRQPEPTERAATGTSFPDIREVAKDLLNSDLSISSAILIDQKPQINISRHFSSSPLAAIFDERNSNQINGVKCEQTSVPESGFKRTLRNPQTIGEVTITGSSFITAFGFNPPTPIPGTVKTLQEVKAESVVPIGDVASKTGFVSGGRELIVNSQASAIEVAKVVLDVLGFGAGGVEIHGKPSKNPALRSRVVAAPLKDCPTCGDAVAQPCY